MISKEGGEVWERLILYLDCPFLALSATVGNPTEFEEWLRKVFFASLCFLFSFVLFSLFFSISSFFLTLTFCRSEKQRWKLACQGREKKWKKRKPPIST